MKKSDRIHLKAVTSKERPYCRKTVISLDLMPYPSTDDWDLIHAITPKGVVTRLSEGMQKQMAKMIDEGLWKGQAVRVPIAESRKVVRGRDQ